MPAETPALLRAYPSPSIQTCFARIRQYVLHRSAELFTVPNQSVVIFTLPKSPAQPEFLLHLSVVNDFQECITFAKSQSPIWRIPRERDSA